MAVIQNNPTIVADEKVNINRSAIEHRATWMAASVCKRIPGFCSWSFSI